MTLRKYCLRTPVIIVKRFRLCVVLREGEDIGKGLEIRRRRSIVEKLSEVSTDIARVDASFPDVFE